MLARKCYMEKIIIYGAGKRGRGIYDLFVEHNISDRIYCFCDRNAEQINSVGDKKVSLYEDIKSSNYPFFISFIDEEQVKITKNMLSENGSKTVEIDEIISWFGYNDSVEFNRMLCGYLHRKSMNEYFEDSENMLDAFWNDNSVFKKRFDTLDCRNIIELACGRGRHVQKYINKSDTVTLVDILQENMDYCKERFSCYDKISYYCNNGYNLEKLDSNSYSALFCYDAMVHFEMLDIYSYLKDIYRVLVPGGRALIHHSNNSKDYKASFANAPNGRAFMSKNLFAHLAYKSGFIIVSQDIIDWEIKNLDCITLIEKPNNENLDS